MSKFSEDKLEYIKKKIALWEVEYGQIAIPAKKLRNHEKDI